MHVKIIGVLLQSALSFFHVDIIHNWLHGWGWKHQGGIWIFNSCISIKNDVWAFPRLRTADQTWETTLFKHNSYISWNRDVAMLVHLVGHSTKRGPAAWGQVLGKGLGSLHPWNEGLVRHLLYISNQDQIPKKKQLQCYKNKVAIFRVTQKKTIALMHARFHTYFLATSLHLYEAQHESYLPRWPIDLISLITLHHTFIFWKQVGHLVL